MAPERVRKRLGKRSCAIERRHAWRLSFFAISDVHYRPIPLKYSPIFRVPLGDLIAARVLKLRGGWSEGSPNPLWRLGGGLQCSRCSIAAS